MASSSTNGKSSVSVKGYFSDNKGSAAVEFALVLPTFLVLIIGVFVVGWTAQGTHNVRFALAEGARALQLKPSMTQTALQTLVRSKVYGGHDPQTINVTLTTDPISAGVKLAHTTATYPVSFTVPLLGSYSFSYSVSMTVPVSAS